jgi:hypothetical protein
MGDRSHHNRRSVLRSIGAAVGVSGVAGIGSAQGEDNDATPIGAADADNNEVLPVAADGKMVVKFRRAQDGSNNFVVDQTFHSPDLNKRYGSSVFEYETHKRPAKLVPEAVRDGQKSEYSFQTQRIIGTEREQRTAERKIWKQHVELNEGHPLHTPTLDGNVPLYQYKEESDAADQNKQDRNSPLNVAWESKETSDIRSTMKSGDNGPKWGAPLSGIKQAKKDQYVNLPDGSTKSTTAHVLKSIGFCPFKQYHIRLYDVPFSEVGAIGQAHRDPCDHGKLSEDTDWKIDKAREKVTEFWKDGHGLHADNPPVGNTINDFPSHSGTWAFYDTNANI